MQINLINNSYTNTKYRRIQNKNTTPMFNYGLKQDTVNFTGLFGKKNNSLEVESSKTSKPQLNANDMILSFKVADILHRLDDENILAIGQGVFLKATVQAQLTKENSFIPSPKSVKNVFVINSSNDSANPIVIARKNKDEFLIYGPAKNFSDPPKYTDYQIHNIAKYDDIIETDNKTKIKFIKSEKESNQHLYDAKYPVESFLTSGQSLDDGFVINEPQDIDNSENITKTTKSKYSKPIPNRTFKDVAGLDDTVKKVKRQIMFPILHPEAFPDIKNRGAIFYGEPGTGKTLVALGLVGEIKQRQNKNIHLINIDGKSLSRSEFGKTEGLWRNVFTEAKQNQPSVIFIDEIDSILEKRQDGSNFVPNNSVVSQFLTLIDDIEKNKLKIWIIGATNRPDRIDDAIIRSGRIGNLIEFKKPNVDGCEDILNHYLKDKNVSEDFDRKAFANKLYQNSFSGADISAIVYSAREHMYEQEGIYDKMDNGTYHKKDLQGLKYQTKHFNAALEELINNK